MEVLGPEDFEGQRLRRSGTWVVDFSAEWCPFCREFLPKFAELGGEGEYQLAIGDLTDAQSPFWDTFRLEVTPTVIAFREGVVVFRRDGRWGEGLDENDLRAVRVALERPSDGPRRASSTPT